MNEQGCKPGYVVDDHLSRPDVTIWLKQPTRKLAGNQCFLLGLASDGVYTDLSCYHESGSLLHYHFTLAINGGLISVALSWESPPLDVIQHPALGSSDFPHRQPFGSRLCDRLENSYTHYFIISERWLQECGANDTSVISQLCGYNLRHGNLLTKNALCHLLTNRL